MQLFDSFDGWVMLPHLRADVGIGNRGEPADSLRADASNVQPCPSPRATVGGSLARLVVNQVARGVHLGARTIRKPTSTLQKPENRTLGTPAADIRLRTTATPSINLVGAGVGIRGSRAIISMRAIPVLYPLEYIPEHVVQSPCIWSLVTVSSSEFALNQATSSRASVPAPSIQSARRTPIRLLSAAGTYASDCVG